ncbi:MAG: hypothetical protein U0746_04755 [Gemmataceae bacterium]
MHSAVLQRYFGSDKQWRGPCVVVIDAEASIQTTGSDSILQSGMKSYAPRLISGRVTADSACLLADESALLLLQTQRIRQATGEDLHQQTLLVVDLNHVAAIEFTSPDALRAFGVPSPPK